MAAIPFVPRGTNELFGGLYQKTNNNFNAVRRFLSFFDRVEQNFFMFFFDSQLSVFKYIARRERKKNDVLQ